MAAIIAVPSFLRTARADYVGAVSSTSANAAIRAAGLEILDNGGGTGSFIYKGGGNAVDAAVAAGLVACVVIPDACSLGGYGGHMMIWKSGWDGERQLVTCIDFNSAAGSLATPGMFVGSVNLTNGHWTGAQRAANQYGWKAAGVPGTFAGLLMAQTNYGRKLDGTNYFPFAEILKPALARIANGQATGNGYYTLSSVSNLLMEIYTNSPGYRDANGNPNPKSSNDPYGVFYRGDIARDIAAAMQANGGLVTYADLTNYQPREVTPYVRHFSCPSGTPAWVCVAPPGSAGLSVLQELTIIEAFGWTNGPDGTWDSLHYWHSRAEAARLMWKDHFQWLGDPWGGVLPPDFLGNGSTNFCEQMLAHATNSYPYGCPWDTNEIRLTNSLVGSIIEAVNHQTNIAISVDWDDIRYGTCNISTSDKWGNCVAVTLSMGGGYGAQVAVTNRGLVLGQGMALFDARPGWPDSIAPGKRPVDNMCPAIVIPDYPLSATNGSVGGRPPFAIGAAGGSTIENNIAMEITKYLMEGPSSGVSDPSVWLYNFEANQTIYMRPSYPTGLQSYLGSVGFTAPGGPPSSGAISYVQAWIPPVLGTQPANQDAHSGSTVTFDVTATGLPLFYQWLRNGIALEDGGTISGTRTPRLTLAAVTNGAAFAVIVSNGAASLTSATAALTIDGAPVILTQPASRTAELGTLVTFSVSATGVAPLAYQWLRNGTKLFNEGRISGATTSQLSVDSVTEADAGTYSIVVSNANGRVTSLGITLTLAVPSTYLSLLWSVGPTDGRPWMNTNTTLTQYVPNQRTLAYNGFSNHLYVISRSSSTTSNYMIYVLNATSGTLLYTLKTNGVQSVVGSGGIGLLGIGVAEDGAVYACNEAPDSEGAGGASPTSYFRVYRWANANSNTLPSLVFAGDPSGSSSALRWGDAFVVRGAGTNTQILLDLHNVLSGSRYAAILSPTNQFLTNFSPRWFVTTNFGTTIGRSLEFDGSNNAIWQKRAGQWLVKTAFDPATSQGGTQIASTNVLRASGFPSGLMGIGLNLPRNLAAGVCYNGSGTADSLNLYDVHDLNAPRLLAQYQFPASPRIANANYISQTFFKNDLLFTIDGNNGIMVFRVYYSPGQLFLYEPFDYANIGGPVSSNTPANWSYGGSGANDLSVVGGNLSYPGLTGSLGNSVTNGATGLGVRRLFGREFNSGKLFFSALFRINDLGFGSWDGKSSMAGGLTATNNTGFQLQVLVKSNSPTGYLIGVQKSGTGATATFDTIEHHAGETLFLVGRYDFTVFPEAATLWINPSWGAFRAASEPANGLTATTGANGLPIDRFNLRQNTALTVPAAVQWDELRVGDSWADLTPPALLEPVRLTAWVKLANGAFRFAYASSDSRTYFVFASTNLVDWQSIGPATQTSQGRFEFVDLMATNLLRRFYRLGPP